MAGVVTNADIFEKIGKLIEGQENANKSRDKMHEKMDVQAELITTIRSDLAQTVFTLKATTDIAVQARNAVNELKDEFERDREVAADKFEAAESFRQEAKPIIEVMKSARTAIWVLIALLGISGMSAAAILTFANDSAKQIVRDWLDIDQ